jgi:nitroreductase
MPTMELREAIEQRKSVRAFRQEPVPRKVLDEILGKALRAPSWGNTQPWRVTVVGGKILESMVEDFLKKAAANEPPCPDVEFPQAWPDSLSRRYKESGRRLFDLLGIEREDRERRDHHRLSMLRLFGAPQAIYLHQEQTLSPYSIFDAGLLAQNITLLAAETSIGTCFLAVSVLYPDIIRKYTGIPASDRILIGLAVGYPDEDAPINQFRSERVPVENVVRWVDGEKASDVNSKESNNSIFKADP